MAFTGTKAKAAGANVVGNVQTVFTITGFDDDLTLTSQEAADVGVIDVTATANSKSIIFPAAIPGKILVVKNTTSATNGVTIKVTGKTGITVAAAKSAILLGNGTDFVRVTADA